MPRRARRRHPAASTPKVTRSSRPSPDSSRGNDSHNVRHDYILIAAIFAFALILRLIYIWQLSGSPLFDNPAMDEAYHDQWAQAIASGDRFVDGPYFRAPLYPAFLGAVYWVFGHGFVAARIIQAIIGSLSCVLVFLIGRRIGGRVGGAVAGFAAASYWMLIYFDGELLIPSLIVFLDLLLILLLLHSAERPGSWRFGLCGVVLGLSAIARPNLLLLGPAIVAWLVAAYWHEPSRWLRYAASVTVGCLLCVLPITARNYFVGDDLVLIASQGGVNFYIGNNPQSDGRTAIVPGTPGGWWEGYYATIERAETARGRKLKPSEVSDYYYGEAFRFVREQPGVFAALMWKKLRLFWTRWEMSNNKDIYFWVDEATPVLKFLPLGFGLIGPLGLVGLVLSLRRPKELFPLWGFVAVYMVSVVLFFCTSRYRMPVVPILIVLSVYAVVEVGRAVAGGAWRTIAIALVAALPATLFVYVTPATKPFRNDAFAYTRMGAAYVREGKFEQAEKSYLKALELAPKFLTARFNYARLLRKMGRLDEAIEQFRRAAAAGSKRMTGEPVSRLAEVHFELAHALSAKGDYAGAVEHYRESIRLDPTLKPGQVQFNLGVMLEQLGRSEEARAAFGEALPPLRKQLADKPRDPQLLFAVGRSLIAQGAYAEAIDVLKRCLAVNPQHTEALRFLRIARERMVGKP